MTVEIKLRAKYRKAGSTKAHKKSNHGGNSGKTGMGNHAAHPDVFAFRRNGYKVEGKWNVHQTKESTPVRK